MVEGEGRNKLGALQFGAYCHELSSTCYSGIEKSELSAVCSD